MPQAPGRPPAAPGRRPPARPRQTGFNWAAYWPVGAMGLLILAAVAGLYLFNRSGPPAPRPVPSESAAAVVDTVTHLDVNQTAALGAAGLGNPLKAAKGQQPLVGPSGRPLVLYVGAGYCPYCAAERWSIAIALSRFGTLSGVGLTTSSSTDIYPNTPTLSFNGTTLQSSSIEFQGVEISDRFQKPLQAPTAAQQRVMQALDPQGSIPFLDIGNRQVGVGAGYLPDNLQGLTWQQVARNLQDTSNPLSRQVIGNANWITAAICQAAGESAAPVCSAAAIRTLESQLGS